MLIGENLTTAQASSYCLCPRVERNEDILANMNANQHVQPPVGHGEKSASSDEHDIEFETLVQQDGNYDRHGPLDEEHEQSVAIDVSRQGGHEGKRTLGV